MPSLSSSAQPPPQWLTSRTRNSGTHTLGPKKNQRKRKVPIVSVVIDAESMEAASNWLSLGLAAWSSGSAGTRAAAKDGAARVELIDCSLAAAAMDGSGGKRTAVLAFMCRRLRLPNPRACARARRARSSAATVQRLLNENIAMTTRQRPPLDDGYERRGADLTFDDHETYFGRGEFAASLGGARRQIRELGSENDGSDLRAAPLPSNCGLLAPLPAPVPLACAALLEGAEELERPPDRCLAAAAAAQDARWHRLVHERVLCELDAVADASDAGAARRLRAIDEELAALPPPAAGARPPPSSAALERFVVSELRARRRQAPLRRLFDALDAAAGSEWLPLLHAAARRPTAAAAAHADPDGAPAGVPPPLADEATLARRLRDLCDEHGVAGGAAAASSSASELLAAVDATFQTVMAKQAEEEAAEAEGPTAAELAAAEAEAAAARAADVRADAEGEVAAAAEWVRLATEELAALEETAATCELVAGSRAVYDSIDGQINVTVVSVLRDSNGVVYTLLLPDGTNARVDKRNVLRAVRVEETAEATASLERARAAHDATTAALAALPAADDAAPPPADAAAPPPRVRARERVG